MIWNEIRNRIEANGDIHESKNNSRNKERKEYQNQERERVRFLASRTVSSYICTKEQASNIWTCKSRVVRKRPSECMCVKGRARAYKQGA